MATSVFYSRTGILSDEETNYLRAAHLITHICPKAVRILFDSRHSPGQLTGELAAKQSILQHCKGISKIHWPILFPAHGVVKSSDFDITLMMTLLRNFTGISQPSTRWDTMPAANNHSVGADLVRIRLYRNEVMHSNEATLADSDFNILWTELENAIDRLSGGTMKTEVSELRNVVLDQTQREILLTSLKHEKELRLHEEKFEEMEKIHEASIVSIRHKYDEEMKGQGKEIHAIKQKQNNEIEDIKKKHKEEMKLHQENIDKQRRDIEAINQKLEEEMKRKEEDIREILQKQTQPIYNITETTVNNQAVITSTQQTQVIVHSGATIMNMFGGGNFINSNINFNFPNTEPQNILGASPLQNVADPHHSITESQTDKET